MAMKKENLPVLVPKTFEHEQFGKIRFVKIDWEPWFVAVDVCKVLELDNVSQALSRLDDDERGSIILNEGTSPKGGSPVRAVVNEFGLYRLIMGSRTPAAKNFQRWVYHDVLPSIRKRGYYVAPHQRVIRINSREEFKAFKAKYPEGAVEIKAQYDGGDIFDVVVHSTEFIANNEVKRVI